MVEHNWCCMVMVEAVNHLTLHPTSILYIYIVFPKPSMLWMGIWVNPYANICVGGGQFLLKIVGMVEQYWRCKVMVGAVNHLTLHPTSILYIYILFQKLSMLWMGIWVYLHANMCAGGGIFFWKFKVWLNTIDAVRSWWGLYTTSLCIPVPYYIYISVSETFYAVNGDMGVPSC